MLTGTHPCDALPKQGGGTSERHANSCRAGRCVVVRRVHGLWNMPSVRLLDYLSQKRKKKFEKEKKRFEKEKKKGLKRNKKSLKRNKKGLKRNKKRFEKEQKRFEKGTKKA